MSESLDQENKLVIAETTEYQEEKSEASTSGMSGDRPTKRVGRRPGRRSSKMDVRAKLERSRQSARECRARKKLRYQYLEDLVANREKAVFALRDELELYKQWCIQVDQGLLPLGLLQLAREKEAAEKAKVRKGNLTKIPEGAEGGEVDPAEMNELESENGTQANTETVGQGKMQHKSNSKGNGRQRVKASTSTESSLDDKIHHIAFSHFKAPRSSAVLTQSQLKHDSGDSSTLLGASGFISDLSNYSTIGLSDLESAINTEHQGPHSLSTITEESSEGSGHDLKAKDTSLLPTFVEDLDED